MQFIRDKRKKYSRPPSRGAWIEMQCVAQSLFMAASRPPRGGRGLKYASAGR